MTPPWTQKTAVIRVMQTAARVAENLHMTDAEVLEFYERLSVVCLVVSGGLVRRAEQSNELPETVDHR